MNSRKLFISFEGVVLGLKGGKITREDLRRGLFAFGSGREFVFQADLWRGDELFYLLTRGRPSDSERSLYNEIHEEIKAALRAAESDTPCRCEWRVPGKHLTFWQVRDLLVRNGYSNEAVPFLTDDLMARVEDVVRWVEECKFDLEVVF